PGGAAPPGGARGTAAPPGGRAGPPRAPARRGAGNPAGPGAVAPRRPAEPVELREAHPAADHPDHPDPAGMGRLLRLDVVHDRVGGVDRAAVLLLHDPVGRRLLPGAV